MAPRLSFTIGGMLLLLSSGLTAQTLVYEREYSLIAEDDNILRIELHPDDRLIVDRPTSMTHAGHHELQAPAGSYDRMLRAFELARTDSEVLYEDIQQMARSGDTEWVVTDPEFSRFARLGADRAVVDQVTAVSLEAWAARFDEPRLDRLGALEREWYALMNAQLAGGER